MTLAKPLWSTTESERSDRGISATVIPRPRETEVAQFSGMTRPCSTLDVGIAHDAIRFSRNEPDALIPRSFADFDWLAVVDSSGYDPGAPPLYGVRWLSSTGWHCEGLRGVIGRTPPRQMNEGCFVDSGTLLWVEKQ